MRVHLCSVFFFSLFVCLLSHSSFNAQLSVCVCRVVLCGLCTGVLHSQTVGVHQLCACLQIFWALLIWIIFRIYLDLLYEPAFFDRGYIYIYIYIHMFMSSLHIYDEEEWSKSWCFVCTFCGSIASQHRVEPMGNHRLLRKRTSLLARSSRWLGKRKQENWEKKSMRQSVRDWK